MNGFRRYNALKDVQYCTVPFVPDKLVETRSKAEDLMDLIFSVDKETNMPIGSINMYLSEKTRDEVRQFIEQQLLIDLPDQSIAGLPDDINQEFKKLPSDFLAIVSRDRFESNEDYESRLQSYFDSVERVKQTEQNMRNLNKKPKVKDE